MGRKFLSDSDRQLWKKVTETVTPLEDRPKAAELPRRLYVDIDDTDRALPPEWYMGQSTAPRPTLDKHNRRQIRIGSRPIEKTLDLHGMTQDQAFSALKATLEQGIRQGLRTLIVVTGKGGRRWAQTDGSTIATRKREDFDQFGGVLKRMVPLWLSSRDLAPLVHSYSEASRDHGGAGALYVLLRRSPKNSKGARP